jgi:hypothetical protein
MMGEVDAMVMPLWGCDFQGTIQRSSQRTMNAIVLTNDQEDVSTHLHCSTTEDTVTIQVVVKVICFSHSISFYPSLITLR